MVQVDSNGAGLEQRLSSLQSQIDGLRRAAGDDERPLEQRLSSLTEFSADILKRWAATADRHAKAVSQLEAHLHELGDASTRLQQDASQRLHELERIVQQEWTALRDLHEAPVRQLVEQAASLTEVCIATAHSAQHGFDRAEARLATLEDNFNRTTADLTREVQSLLAEVRQLSLSNSRQLTGDGPSWPLEDVTRLHHQLRETTVGPRALAATTVAALPAAIESTVQPDPPPAEPVLTRSTSTIADPAAAVAVDATVPEPGREPVRAGGLSRPVMAVIAVLVLVSAGYAWTIQRDMRAATERVEQSRRESQAAAETASRQAAERQEAAARQLDAARDLAARAQTIGDVLAAPDLVRYTLVNTGTLPAASGQVLWSRSRGFVFSASGLAAPPANTTYQIWLLTRGGAVSAGTFVPDATGRVTVTASLNVPRPVFSAVVTTERTGGAETPTGEPLLMRLPAAPATPPAS